MKDLEQRLAAVFSMSFCDSSSLLSRLRLIEAFSPLLSRPSLKEAAAYHHPQLLQQLKEEVQTVHALFLSGCSEDSSSSSSNSSSSDSSSSNNNNTFIYINRPPVAKALSWAAALLSRIKEPLDRMQKLGILLSPTNADTEPVTKQCYGVIAAIQQFQEKIVNSHTIHPCKHVHACMRTCEGCMHACNGRMDACSGSIHVVGTRNG